jgi:hypothetical protein
MTLRLREHDARGWIDRRKSMYDTRPPRDAGRDVVGDREVAPQFAESARSVVRRSPTSAAVQAGMRRRGPGHEDLQTPSVGMRTQIC